MGPDGFVLRETVAEYVEILTLTVGELASELGISVPKGMPQSLRVRIFGGGPLVLDEYGQVKYQIRTTLEGNRSADEATKIPLGDWIFRPANGFNVEFCGAASRPAMDQEAADVPQP